MKHLIEDLLDIFVLGITILLLFLGCMTLFFFIGLTIEGRTIQVVYPQEEQRNLPVFNQEYTLYIHEKYLFYLSAKYKLNANLEMGYCMYGMHDNDTIQIQGLLYPYLPPLPR